MYTTQNNEEKKTKTKRKKTKQKKRKTEAISNKDN